jgi:hypothetical protein
MLLQLNADHNATLNRPNMFHLTRSVLPVGFVINPARAQTDLGKCSYTYDGATWYRLNGGCGANIPGPTCDNCSCQYTAFKNICPSTNKTCAADDVEIKSAACGGWDVSSVGFSECFWGMPSLNYPEKLGPNHLRQMVKARLKADRKSLDPVTRSLLASLSNEVVIDDRLLIPAIRSDPAAVVLAFVYVKSSKGSRSIAEGMRDRFSEDYSVGKIPVIGIDDTVDFTPSSGPFIVEKGNDVAVIMV